MASHYWLKITFHRALNYPALDLYQTSRPALRWTPLEWGQRGPDAEPAILPGCILGQILDVTGNELDWVGMEGSVNSTSNSFIHKYAADMLGQEVGGTGPARCC